MTVELISGARASEVRKLEAIAERACAALERHPPAALWKAVKELELWIGGGWTDDGWAVEFRQPADIFADSDGFQSSLAGRTREARIVAFPVLAAVSIDEAVPLYMEAAVLDLEGAEAASHVASLVNGFHLHAQALLGYLDRQGLDDRHALELVAALGHRPELELARHELLGRMARGVLALAGGATTKAHAKKPAAKKPAAKKRTKAKAKAKKPAAKKKTTAKTKVKAQAKKPAVKNKTKAKAKKPAAKKKR